MFLFFITNILIAQNLEVEGKVRISEMDIANSSDSMVVRLPDGTLAVRNAESLIEYQVLSISNDTVFLTNGAFVKLPENPDPDPLNEIQELEVQGDTIFISDGNFVILPGLSNLSLIPTCSDSLMNGNETGVDCGGAYCVSCEERCSDGVKNGDEEGIDCGGSSCDPCPSCNDGILNGNEERIDCGGPDCEPCKLLDIIMVVDNSGDMAVEMDLVESSVNNSLANILFQQGIDLRIILISDYNSICFPPPLNPDCSGGTPTNTDTFYNYSQVVGSQDALCQLLDGYNSPDAYNLAPNGWQDWIREDALKAFIFVTTDGVSCSYNSNTLNDQDMIMAGETVADNFAMFLEALSSTQFGTAQNPKYVAHGILGIANKNGISSNPYLPSDPITLSGCVSSVDPGTGYQAVCKNTGGRRYSICENSFDTIFSDIASELINALSGI